MKKRDLFKIDELEHVIITTPWFFPFSSFATLFLYLYTNWKIVLNVEKEEKTC